MKKLLASILAVMLVMAMTSCSGGNSGASGDDQAAQQGGLTGTAGAENGDEFVIPQVQADIIQCFLHQIAGLVFFLDVVELEHV